MTGTMRRVLRTLCGAFAGITLLTSAAFGQITLGQTQPSQVYKPVTPNAISSNLQQLGFSTAMAQMEGGTAILGERDGMQLLAFHLSCAMNEAPNCAIVVWGEGTTFSSVPGNGLVEKLAFVGMLNGIEDYSAVTFSPSPADDVLVVARIDIYSHGGIAGNIRDHAEILHNTALEVIPSLPNAPSVSQMMGAQSVIGEQTPGALGALPGTGLKMASPDMIRNALLAGSVGTEKPSVAGVSDTKMLPILQQLAQKRLQSLEMAE